MTKYEFSHEKFKNHYGKLCPCLIPTRETAVKENMCPCREFIEEKKCRCGLFKETTPKKVLITGSRSFEDVEVMKKIITENIGLSGKTLVHGGALGVDTIAQKVCDYYSIKTEIIRPVKQDIKVHYLHRNAEMIGMCDEVIAIWDGESRGTKFTIDYAKARNKKIKIYDFNGEVMIDGKFS